MSFGPPLALVALVALFVSSPAMAAEVQVEGFYRSRLRLFDSLSLDRSLASSEGLSFAGDHRLWLRPKILISHDVGLFVDVLALDGLGFGDQPGVVSSPVSTAPPTFDDSLGAPTSATDPSRALQDLTIWRAWGEVHTSIGRFQLGRLPLHWGSGIWLNDGLRTNPAFADHGDTADRIGWELLVRDEFLVGLAVDTQAEGFINAEDDRAAFNGTLGYRSETVAAGMLFRLDHTSNPVREQRFNLFSVDLALDATIGRIEAHTEFVGQFGGGALPVIGEGTSVTAFGSILDLSLNLDRNRIGLLAGLASGDRDPNDLRLKAFTFDRDYSVGLVLFEQAMPRLLAAAPTDANGGFSMEEALAGEAISNALFIKPTFAQTLGRGWEVDAGLLTARPSRLPEEDAARRGYGLEIQAGTTWTGKAHFDFGLHGAAFLPGTYFRSALSDLGATYDDPVFGAQMTGRVHF